MPLTPPQDAPASTIMPASSTTASTSASAAAQPTPANKAASTTTVDRIGKLKRVAFPPAHLAEQLAPEDKNDSLLMMICSALAAVDNRALCPKEIAEIIMYWGWTTPGSQPFAVISTCIRAHLKRRGLGLNNVYNPSGPPPLFSSWDLTTTIPTEDQPCMGIDPEAKPAVKRGTLWYLSKTAGFDSPFGDRHPDSLFAPPPPKKTAPASKPQKPKEAVAKLAATSASSSAATSTSSAAHSSASLPAASSAAAAAAASPATTAAPLAPPATFNWTFPTTLDSPFDDQADTSLELGRGKRKRKISRLQDSESTTASSASPSSSKPFGLSASVPASHHKRSVSTDPLLSSSAGARRLKVRLNAPTPCPVFSHPIDNEDDVEVSEDDEDATMATDGSHLELNGSAVISPETLALERKRFRKRSRSESNMLLATPVPMPGNTPTSGTGSGLAPDYFAPAHAHGSSSMPLSMSAPVLDSWTSSLGSDMMEVEDDVDLRPTSQEPSSSTSATPAEEAEASHAFTMDQGWQPQASSSRPSMAALASGLGIVHQEDSAFQPSTEDPASDLLEGEESGGEGGPDFVFDVSEDTVSTAATTPRSPVQVKEESVEFDDIFAETPRDQHSPVPDLPNLPIVTQAEGPVKHEEPSSEAEAHEESTLVSRLFAQPRQRSISPDESLYTFAHPRSPSMSQSREASPGEQSISEAAVSPLPFDDDDFLEMEDRDEDSGGEEVVARESLSPVIDMSELDLGLSMINPSRHHSHQCGRVPTTPFGPEVFGLVGEAPAVPWQPPAKLLSCEAFNVTVIPASDDYVDLSAADDADSVASREDVDAANAAHKSSSPDPDPHISSTRVEPRSTRSGAARKPSAPKKRPSSMAPQPISSKPSPSSSASHTRSATAAAAAAAASSSAASPARSTRSSVKSSSKSLPTPARSTRSKAQPAGKGNATKTSKGQ